MTIDDIAITIRIPPVIFEAIKARAKRRGLAWESVASSCLQHIVLHPDIFEEMEPPS